LKNQGAGVSEETLRNASPFFVAMDDKNLETKFEKEDAENRLKKLFEMLLVVDLKVVDELCEKERKKTSTISKPSSKRSLTNSV